MHLSPFKKEIQAHFDNLSAVRRFWKEKNRSYHEAQGRFLRFLIPPGQKVLELGCGTGELLDALHPSAGVGIDLSSQMVRKASSSYPHLTFINADAEDHHTWGLADKFDFILISDTIGLIEDIQVMLDGLHPY